MMNKDERERYINSNIVRDLERGGEWPLWLYRSRETGNVFNLEQIRKNERAFAEILQSWSKTAGCDVPKYAREVLCEEG